MSGGHWNYSDQRLRDQLQEIGQDSEIMRRFPYIARTLERMGDTMFDIQHELDWDLCSDSPIRPTDKEWEMYQLLRLLRDIQLPYELEKLLRR